MLRIASVTLMSLLFTSPVFSMSGTETIGGNRRARLMMPENHESLQKIPLIVLLHGYTANSDVIDQVFKMSNRINDFNYALILPNGTKDMWSFRFWDAIPYCCGNKQARINANDPSYLIGLVKEAKALHSNIDPDRTIFMGHATTSTFSI